MDDLSDDETRLDRDIRTRVDFYAGNRFEEVLRDLDCANTRIDDAFALVKAVARSNQDILKEIKIVNDRQADVEVHVSKTLRQMEEKISKATKSQTRAPTARRNVQGPVTSTLGTICNAHEIWENSSSNTAGSPRCEKDPLRTLSSSADISNIILVQSHARGLLIRGRMKLLKAQLRKNSLRIIHLQAQLRGALVREQIGRLNMQFSQSGSADRVMRLQAVVRGALLRRQIARFKGQFDEEVRIIYLQAQVRGVLVRQQLAGLTLQLSAKKLQVFIVQVQAQLRGVQVRRQILMMKGCFSGDQALVPPNVQHLKRISPSFQAHCRGALVRQDCSVALLRAKASRKRNYWFWPCLCLAMGGLVLCVFALKLMVDIDGTRMVHSKTRHFFQNSRVRSRFRPAA